MSIPAVTSSVPARSSGRGGRAWYRFRRNPAAVIGLILIILVVACAAFAPVIAPYPEHAGYFVNFQERHLPPSAAHLFGTDNIGRDTLSRIIFGYRLIASGLSFLGLGAQPPTPDLGTMVSAGADYLPDYWWESVIPGLAILVAILEFNLFGDGLRDLLDVEMT